MISREQAECGENHAVWGEVGDYIPEDLPSDVCLHHSLQLQHLFPLILPSSNSINRCNPALCQSFQPFCIARGTASHQSNRPFSFHPTTFVAMGDVFSDREATLVMDPISLTDFDSRSSPIQPLTNRILLRLH
jgi:hypothetical protein